MLEFYVRIHDRTGFDPDVLRTVFAVSLREDGDDLLVRSDAGRLVSVMTVACEPFTADEVGTCSSCDRPRLRRHLYTVRGGVLCPECREAEAATACRHVHTLPSVRTEGSVCYRYCPACEAELPIASEVAP